MASMLLLLALQLRPLVLLLYYFCRNDFFRGRRLGEEEDGEEYT